MKSGWKRSVALLCLLLTGCGAKADDPVDKAEAAIKTAAQQAPAVEQAQMDSISVSEPSAEETSQAEATESYVSPIDFVELHRTYPDIYGWLYIPDTNISYPLVQRAGEDAYYLKHDIDGNASVGGAIYTESTYNTITMEDPVTVIYGHQLYNGKMFSDLQSLYSQKDSFASHQKFAIFLENKALYYEVVAALPFDTRHILYSYDFSDPLQFTDFFHELQQSRALDAVYAENFTVSPDDKIVILSTCYSGDYSKRFLVVAKCYATAE